MKQELYFYAQSLEKKNLSRVPVVCVWILLVIFLIPLVFSNVWISLLLLLSYLFLYSRSKKITDDYNKNLITLGLFLLFLGIEFCALLLFQYRAIVSLTMTILVFTISYEILWFIKISKRMYSRNTQPKGTWIYILPSIFGGTGFWLGRLIAKSENTEFKVWVMILLCSLLIVGSFSLFQKYFISKFVNK